METYPFAAQEAGIKIIRILIVQNHNLIRECLRMLIEKEPEMLVVGSAGNRADALAIAAREHPDVIVFDLDDLRGEDVINSISALITSSEGSRVLTLAGINDSEKYCRALQFGAIGMLLKDQAGKTLIKAIKKVHAGEAWIDRTMTAKVLIDFARAGTRRSSENELEAVKIGTLSRRERQVITLVAKGLVTKQIAKQLVISEKTVGNHLTTIYHKLDVSNRLELALYALRHGLLCDSAYPLAC